MHKSGILVHVHHLDTAGWHDLLWGDPAADRFGSLATVVYLLLTVPDAAAIDTILVGCGPSYRSGLSEGEYTKRTMLKMARELDRFSRLRTLLAALTPGQKARLMQQLEGIVVTPEIRNTADEIETGARLFDERGVSQIYEVCAASHAPRCVQTLAVARAKSLVPPTQLWMVVPTDICFVGAAPDDTVILEPAHRGDDPVLKSRYTLPKAMKPVIRMPVEVKEELAEMITGFVLDNTPLTKNDLPAQQQIVHR